MDTTRERLLVARASQPTIMNVTTVVEASERLPGVFAQWLAERVSACSRRSFSLAIPGGSVAERLLPAVGGSTFESHDLHLFWVDERAVASDDPASNFGLAKRVWLDAAGIASARVHAMVPAGRTLDEVVRVSEGELAGVLGRPPCLDVALLGVGEDGHVASLFPGHPVLRANGLVAVVTDAPKPPPHRLTLTLSVLLEARVVVIGAMGRAKASVIAEALSGDPSELPVARVVRGARECVLFLDPEAASELGSRHRG